MATAVEPKLKATLAGEQRVLLRGVGRAGYEALLALAGDGHVRITYDRGDAELMSPSHDHEHFKVLISRLVETLTLELNIPCEAAGSTTWRSLLEDRGLEPDACYYLANAGRVTGRRIDPTVDPPPDLCVEIEISRGAMDKLPVYAALGVPEVWRFDGEALQVDVLGPDRTYATAAESPSLPFLPPSEVARWVELGRTTGQTAWLRQFRAWVRDELAPRFERP